MEVGGKSAAPQAASGRLGVELAGGLREMDIGQDSVVCEYHNGRGDRGNPE